MNTRDYEDIEDIEELNEALAEDAEEAAEAGRQCWALAGGLYYGASGVCDRLAPGFYQPIATQQGTALKPVETKMDDIIDLHDPLADEILAEFTLFWQREAALTLRGLVAKRGILLYGPPGSRKTTLVQQAALRMIKSMGGIALLANSNIAVTAGAIQLIRSTEKARPILLVFEDIDTMSGNTQLLALLDGELQIGSIFNVATTNYPERLEARLINRPGRFDRVIEVGMPGPAQRAAYFAAKAAMVSVEERAHWVTQSEGWSVAHMRELVVAVTVLDQKAEDVITRLNEMGTKVFGTPATDLIKKAQGSAANAYQHSSNALAAIQRQNT